MKELRQSLNYDAGRRYIDLFYMWSRVERVQNDLNKNYTIQSTGQLLDLIQILISFGRKYMSKKPIKNKTLKGSYQAQSWARVR